ncbi:MAG TPA: hypothetical protein ENH23_06700 [candidate division Zixibacteria bacterium]|nr:hypothetical protein [candidate division Zixibacteria bacterium]
MSVDLITSTNNPLSNLSNPRTSVVCDVPGKLDWFQKGSSEYQEWVAQRNGFIQAIDSETELGQEIRNDILDCILESELPVSMIGILASYIKITKMARTICKRKQIWFKVIDAIIQLTFTAPYHENDEFIFSFHQVQHLWRSYGGDALTIDDFKKIYSTIDTKLRVGKLKNKILNFPSLDTYVGYKLRQFKYSYQNYQISLIEN